MKNDLVGKRTEERISKLIICSPAEDGRQFHVKFDVHPK